MIVGINSDRSTRALKGAGRPINPASDRAEVVAALRSVDASIIFDGDTALELVEALRPDIYVKGGDYSSDPAGSSHPPEAQAVSKYGGAVTILDLIPNRSTSRTLSRISGQEQP